MPPLACAHLDAASPRFALRAHPPSHGRHRLLGHLAIAAALLLLRSWAATPARADEALVVRHASLETRERPWGGSSRRETTCRADIEFEERRLQALQDDETDMEIAVVDGRGHGAHSDISDLEACEMIGDTAMTCPEGPTFERVLAEPPRWRVGVEFTRPSRAPSDGFHGPITVRFSYLSEGEKLVHVGVIDRCSAARGGQKLVCKVRGWAPRPAGTR